jgi:hypothetical protein
MAKKGGKRPGGGGGKQRKYTRDNNGRFASTGTGATARGGRLKTASGNKRKTQTAKMTGSKTASTVAKTKGLKPQSARSLKTGIAVNRMRSINQKIGKGQDTAAVNIPMSGTRGKRLNAEISRNVNAQKATNRAASKASNAKFRSEQSRAKKLREVHLGSLAAGYAKKSGKKVADVKATIKGMSPSGQIKLFRQYVKENRATAKPAAPKAAKAAGKTVRAVKTPRTGQEAMKGEVRKIQNKILSDLNAKIKSAGPSATNLRLEKLALKTKMIDTQPKQTAKQTAKSAKQDVAIRGRIAEMRRQNARVARAQANVVKNADVRNSATQMSKASFARKPSKKTLKSQLRADAALAFYANPAKALKTVNKRKTGFRLPRPMR